MPSLLSIRGLLVKKQKQKSGAVLHSSDLDLFYVVQVDLNISAYPTAGYALLMNQQNESFCGHTAPYL